MLIWSAVEALPDGLDLDATRIVLLSSNNSVQHIENMMPNEMGKSNVTISMHAYATDR
jgi:hypothetical protein